VVGVWALEIAEGEVRAISSIVNPDKLRHLGTVGDLRSIPSASRPLH
jgi:RNA polymerase sigma-70 factor (ECF subfamily)